MKIYSDLTETIGNTPLVCLQKLPRRFNCVAEIVLKLESFNPAKSVEEGIISGISTGAIVYTALQVGRRCECENKLIVAFQPSGGERYLSTEMFQ